MKKFFAEEALEGENQYECSNCDRYTDANKK
jgi:ubiquitin C-terminal hydrolase